MLFLLRREWYLEISIWTLGRLIVMRVSLPPSSLRDRARKYMYLCMVCTGIHMHSYEDIDVYSHIHRNAHQYLCLYLTLHIENSTFIPKIPILILYYMVHSSFFSFYILYSLLLHWEAWFSLSHYIDLLSQSSLSSAFNLSPKPIEMSFSLHCWNPTRPIIYLKHLIAMIKI